MIYQAFCDIFGAEPEAVSRAPGRVNLIGEHTDYNDGFVLPAAIDRAIEFAGRRRGGRTVTLHSLNFGDRVEFSLDAIQPDSAHSWSNYFRGVSKYLEEDGYRLSGAEVVFGGNVPRESGLSSSASVEVGAVAMWQKLLTLDLSPRDGILLARRAENQFVGVPSGIMDQFVSALGRRGHALFLDCRDLSYQHVPLREGVRIVVFNSGVKRALAQSEYEVRVQQCRQAVAQLGSVGLAVRSLRDVDRVELDVHADSLDELLLKRARHVVSENRRVLEAVRALEQGELERFGELMNESHESLRDDYEVSSRELDTLVELARSQPGVLGARMTGAGFGGCTVNLVRADASETVCEKVQDKYAEKHPHRPEAYIFQASDGAWAGK